MLIIINRTNVMKYTEHMFEIANQYTPEGSTATAVMDQWVHAISNNFDLSCAP